MDYDFINLGTGDISVIDELLLKDPFPIISANTNLYDKKLSRHIHPYIIKKIHNITIGITGINNDGIENLHIENPFQINNPLMALNKIISELKNKTDFIILLSQLNGEKTSAITKQIPDIDLALCIDNYKFPDAVSSNVMSIRPRGREIGIIKISKQLSIVKIKSTERLLLDQNKLSDEYVFKLAANYSKEFSTTEKERKEAEEHKKLIENLTKMTFDEFLQQYKINGEDN